MTVVVAALYQFVAVDDWADWRSRWLDRAGALGIRGTLLLAQEGINGTIAGTREAIDQMLVALRSHPALTDLSARESIAPAMPFQRLKIKLKREIVTFNQPVAPTERTGTRVAPTEWNALIADPEVKLIDTRNQFEVEIGSFQGAIDPETQTFTEFPDAVERLLDPQRDRKVAMFCTGGIRCEKASAYLLAQGFEQVYQLEGGILNYLATVDPAESAWQGECFVFDERVALQHGLQPGTYQMCRACGRPVDRDLDTCPHCQSSLGDAS